MDLKSGLFSGERIGWMVIARGLLLMALCPDEVWSRVVSPKCPSWDLCSLISLSTT